MIIIRKHILEGHRWDTDMRCEKCGVLAMNIDRFKSANGLKFIECEYIQMLQEKKRMERKYIKMIQKEKDDKQ